MKRFYLHICFVLATVNFAFGQYTLKNAEDVNWYRNITQEKIYVHFNTSLLFSGERLAYKVYCLNADTGLYSSTSKMAYVELVGEDGLVFKHKIKLVNGTGQSDFFIPVSLQTGNYKLLAYTRWMRNGVDTHYFEGNINIINPYLPIEFSDSAVGPVSVVNSTPDQYQQIKVSSNKEVYAKREKVNLSIESLNAANAYGSYSISVKKREELPYEAAVSLPQNYHNIYTDTHKSQSKSIGETIFLPEFKGEMLTGKVYLKDTNELVSGVQVALSILSEEAYQDIASTNKDGIFYFQITAPYRATVALAQVYGDERARYRIEINEHQSLDHSQLKFNDFQINAAHKEKILERSINNQIENAFSEVKVNRLVEPRYPKPFYGNFITTYLLDEYTRFATVGETLIEVVDHAWHERKGGKTRYINVRERENDPYYLVDILPMVVVDGAIIQDHESIIYMDADIVESISVIRDEFYYDNKVFQGVLIVNTFDKDYYKTLQDDYIATFNLFKPQLNVMYHNPEYVSEADLSRIPDNREQLFWMPHFELRSDVRNVDFFTSDKEGTYEITLRGFTVAGKPISITKTITVE